MIQDGHAADDDFRVTASSELVNVWGAKSASSLSDHILSNNPNNSFITSCVPVDNQCLQFVDRPTFIMTYFQK